MVVRIRELFQRRGRICVNECELIYQGCRRTSSIGVKWGLSVERRLRMTEGSGKDCSSSFGRSRKW